MDTTPERARKDKPDFPDELNSKNHLSRSVGCGYLYISVFITPCGLSNLIAKQKIFYFKKTFSYTCFNVIFVTKQALNVNI